jgi:hypothetical protein
LIVELTNKESPPLPAGGLEPMRHAVKTIDAKDRHAFGNPYTFAVFAYLTINSCEKMVKIAN